MTLPAAADADGADLRSNILIDLPSYSKAAIKFVHSIQFVSDEVTPRPEVATCCCRHLVLLGQRQTPEAELKLQDSASFYCDDFGGKNWITCSVITSYDKQGGPRIDATVSTTIIYAAIYAPARPQRTVHAIIMSTYAPNPSIAPLVADIGSYSTKIGYAGEDHPQGIYLSSTAALRDTSGSSSLSCFQSSPRRDFVTRTLCKDDDGDYELVNPVDDVTGWPFSRPSQCSRGASLSSNPTAAHPPTAADAWESHELINHYLQHAFQHGMGLSPPQHHGEYGYAHPLLLLDKPHTPPPLRQRLLEILFEQHSLPAVFFLRDAIAACYAVGKTTATVVDCGYSSTMVTPVYEGFVERRGVSRNNACGARAVEERVLEMMDGLVVAAGRKRRDRLRRVNAKKVYVAGGAGEEAHSPVKRESLKRDSTGRFLKESGKNPNEHPIPDYLMPLYQVRRAPAYNTRSGPFHHWARMALARELKEGGIGVAVGNMGGEYCDASRGGGAANSANSMFMTSNKVPYTLPDGTPVEITAISRCDIAELYFGNDPYNNAYRERILEESKTKLKAYETEVEEYCSNWEPSEEDKKAIASIGSSAAAGDAYSNTSYRGEKSSRHGVRRSKTTTFSPTTISAKLYAACLPYLRTSPPKSSSSDVDTVATGSSSMTSLQENERYFSYLTSAPPAQMVCDAAFRCDRDQQGSLLGNVVVCGGGACLPGIGSAAPLPAGGVAQLNEDAFPDRLREEIEAIVHRHTMGWRVKVTSPNVSERAVCSWLGGSILGSLGTFQDMWVSKRDYEEFGAAIVNRKCP
ncbi:hypothetical protein HJC23_003889 [Cyclotella cryptica]|uniref:Uncharacterized protein n=1 Tax=Cyclotella cryptica TaxID=29204 RepID=A0ABD3PNV5_9STRA|eukprot:CCRYP_013260-RA/>CCRYP_013260-RA protein AED:0.25 eAED:0.14 QI:0/0/0/0.66/1/1/3/0/801